MSKIWCLAGVTLLLVMWFPVGTHAEVPETYLRLGVSAQDFGYKEFNEQDVLLDREDGSLPGFAVEIGKVRSSASAALRFELFDGVVKYDGRTQSGIPLKTDTGERIITFEALLRFDVKALAVNDGVFIAGLGHREWQRDIRATNITSSLFEIYRWKYLMLGGAMTLWRQGNWSGEIDVRWLRPISPTMSLHLSGFDKTTLNLKPRNSMRLNFNFRFSNDAGQQWTISPYWESWYLGRSDDENLTLNGVPLISTVHEPRSETSVGGVTISVRL